MGYSDIIERVVAFNGHGLNKQRARIRINVGACTVTTTVPRTQAQPGYGLTCGLNRRVFLTADPRINANR